MFILMVLRYLLVFVWGPSRFCTRSAVVLYLCRTVIENYSELQLDVTFLCDDTHIYTTVKPRHEDIVAAVGCIKQCIIEIRICTITT